VPPQSRAPRFFHPAPPAPPAPRFLCCAVAKPIADKIFLSARKKFSKKIKNSVDTLPSFLFFYTRI